MTWADDRARLNHDVLSNHIEMELLALQSRPDGNAGRLQQFVQRDEEFRGFLDRGLEALSPVRVFEQPIFAVWSESMLRDVSVVAQALFLATSGIPEHISNLKQSLAVVQDAAQTFLALPNRQRTAVEVIALRRMIARLRDGISALPREPGEGGRHA